MSITIQEDLELTARCPHCDAVLTEIRAKAVPAVGSASFLFGKRYVYTCPRCNKLLAITQRKGFWAG